MEHRQKKNKRRRICGEKSEILKLPTMAVTMLKILMQKLKSKVMLIDRQFSKMGFKFQQWFCYVKSFQLFVSLRKPVKNNPRLSAPNQKSLFHLKILTELPLCISKYEKIYQFQKILSLSAFNEMFCSFFRCRNQASRWSQFTKWKKQPCYYSRR